ncbi:DUF3017 domain-containing protein [Corynebacterium cystitidis]|uniref:DUF3017 domain-containing protein n=1 Tax=Corynebacterium cystitidis TaxID=35757 RepID=UPI00211ECAE6|nr:DUF3017 domain-containing protein [Corynebacterium cystitidis]
MPTLDNPHDLKQKPSKLPAWVQYSGIALFVVGLAVASGLALTAHWRRASFVLGLTMIWLAVLRLTCDSRKIGLVAVRSRRFDTLFTTALGAAMVWLAVSVDSLGS